MRHVCLLLPLLLVLLQAAVVLGNESIDGFGATLGDDDTTEDELASLADDLFDEGEMPDGNDQSGMTAGEVSEAAQEAAAVEETAAAPAETAAPASADEPSSAVHALFHLTYGSPSVDKSYLDWATSVEPHPSQAAGGRYPDQRSPERALPEDAACTYRPQRGLYSSRDTTVLAAQFAEARRARIGVLVVRFPGRPMVGDRPLDAALDLAFDAAEASGVKMSFLIDDYPQRSPSNIKTDIQYLVGKYGSRPGLYRDAARGNRPWVYVHDDYRFRAADLGQIFRAGGRETIRGTPFDVVALGLYRNDADSQSHVLTSGFDGIHTYFASTGFTDGSNPSKWPALTTWASSNQLLFVPSVAPGHDDRSVRPWNRLWRRDRSDGKYYAQMWGAATTAGPPDAVLIHSFNGWASGTQIESVQEDAAKPRLVHTPADRYVTATAEHVAEYESRRAEAAREKNEL